jgi:hypothetical protein
VSPKTESSEIDPDDVDRLLEAIETEIPQPWPEWPGGWRHEIEAAVIDTVFSLRAKYGGPDSGVRAVVSAWRTERGVKQIDDLNALAAYSGRGDELASILGNQQTLNGGSLKAEGAALAASRLIDVGVRHSDHLTGSDDQRTAWQSVPGLGKASWSYLLMLRGFPGVKADVMVTRFVSGCLGRTVPSTEAGALVKAAATKSSHDLTSLDHAIWSHERSRR